MPSVLRAINADYEECDRERHPGSSHLAKQMNKVTTPGTDVRGESPPALFSTKQVTFKNRANLPHFRIVKLTFPDRRNG
jgi:hypothetical protein